MIIIMACIICLFLSTSLKYYINLSQLQFKKKLSNHTFRISINIEPSGLSNTAHVLPVSKVKTIAPLIVLL
jgi:hypothetical protein